MLRFTRMVGVYGIIISILICNTVYAFGENYDGTTIVSKSESRAFLPGRKKNNINRKNDKCIKEKEEIIRKAEELVPGIKEQWDSVQSDFDKVKEELQEQKNKNIGEKNKIKKELNEKVEKGEVTKEEARKQLEDLKNETRNMNQLNKENREAKIQKAMTDWKLFEEAVEKEDKTEVEKTFQKVLENRKEHVEDLKKILE